jgi:hypothetical protein
MDNINRPPGGADPQDSRSTEQFWAPPPGPSKPGPHGPGTQPPASPHQRYATDRRHAGRWTIGLTLALVLAAGGVLTGVVLASHATPAGGAAPASDSTGSSTGAASQPGSQAAALNTALNAADAPGTLALTSVATSATGGTGQAVAATAKARPCRRAVAALRAARRAGRPALARAARAAVLAHCHGLRRRLFRVFLLRGIDGQYTFRTKQGTIRTLAFERGVIQSASGTGIVVRAVDGTTWTWDLVGNTVVREAGKKTTSSALTSGEPVWVGGSVVSGARDARLVVIRPPSASSTTTPAPSASGS